MHNNGPRHRQPSQTILPPRTNALLFTMRLRLFFKVALPPNFGYTDSSALLLSLYLYYVDGGRISVVTESELKSEEPGFDPLAGQGEEHFFYPSVSTLVQTCLCLTPDPPPLPPLRVYGVGSIQLVGRRTRDYLTSVTLSSNPVKKEDNKNNCEFFRVKNVVLTRCRCVRPPCAYAGIRTIIFIYAC